MNRIYVSTLVTSLSLLASCGGGSGGTSDSNTLDITAKSGQYVVEVVEALEEGTCVRSSEEARADFHGVSGIGKNNSNVSFITLPRANVTLLGEVLSNRILASGGYPISETGAAIIEATWIESGTESFDVKYTYTEAFEDRDADCYREFEGNAVLPN